MAEPLTRTDIKRVVDAVARWDTVGRNELRHKPDAVDYGRIDVAILRDIRGLLATIDSLTADLKSATDSYRKVIERFLSVEDQRDAASTKVERLEAALKEIASYEFMGCPDIARTALSSDAQEGGDQ